MKKSAIIGAVILGIMLIGKPWTWTREVMISNGLQDDFFSTMIFMK